MQKKLFNAGWSFALVPFGSLGEGERPDASSYSPVDIPHDWLIHDTKKLYADGDGYYKKEFTVDDPAGNVYILRFDGVYMDSEVYLNGKKIYEWKYGYTTFDVELSGLTAGRNLIEVIVHHKSPNSRWYSGAGIFRNVWLTESKDSRILPDGVYFFASPKDESHNVWTVTIDTEVTGSGEGVIFSTLSGFGQGCGVTTPVSLTEEAVTVRQSFEVSSPELWDVDSPRLYDLTTVLKKDGEEVYTVSQRVGFKHTSFTVDNGFFLNGRSLKLHGACMHHDMGALGSAVNKAAIRRQLSIMKDMGVNSIRTSHNPPAPELMDLADELGIMILSEGFDMWELKKTDYDYARFFPEWHERDVKSWIRRDRSHVSVIMWSIGNEIYDTHASPRAVEITNSLRDCVRKHDYIALRPVTIGSNYMQWQGAQSCAEHIDTVGYNYTERLYDEHHKEHPSWIIYGSETGSTIQSRGIYHFPAEKLTTTHDDHQCSSLLNCATGWGAVNCEYNILMDENRRFSLGQYIWTAFDYIGEPTPYWTKNSYFGHIDTAGFPKDSFYAYRAVWLGERAEPFVHLLPYWDFNEGQLIDIMIFSNCPRTELFVNGVSMGDYHQEKVGATQLTGRWKVPYERGEIKAVGYGETGEILCEEVKRSFGDPVKISLKPDKTSMLSDGEDMIFVEITTLDGEGLTVENSRSRVSVSVEGEGRLVGLDNGDSTDYDQYKSSSRRLFSGRLLAMIASTKNPGDIKVRVSSPGLEDGVLSLSSLPCKKDCGVCCSYEAPRSAESSEVPVRKLELGVSSSVLTPNCPESLISLKIMPGNATYSDGDIGFKVITDAGVETNISAVSKTEDGVKVIAKGDGCYRLRAYCKNGTPYEQVISELELENRGFGHAGFDPYKMVYASLHQESSHKLQDVFEGGVLIPWGDSYVSFKNVDFGKHGSDTLRVWLYLNGYEDIPFEIYTGSGELLGSFNYKLKPWWNHYQSMEIRLSRRLTGTEELKFAFHRQHHFKGFQFDLPIMTGVTIPATGNDGIYGDSFTLMEDRISEIGNNVTISFDSLNFGEEGVSSVTITGRSHNENDTIHIRFHTADGDSNQIVEFEGSEDIKTLTFPLERVKGVSDVRLIFLPGCKFDLCSVRFD